MTTRRWVAVALVLLALVLLAGRALASLYVEYQWYAALGALPLWRARAANTFLLRGLSGAAGSLFVFVNLYAVRHSVVSLVLPRRLGNLEIGEEVPSRYLFAGVVVASLLLGAILTIPQESWTTLDLVRHGQPFGERDPYFQRDLGFYVYWLPFEISLYIWSLIALLLVTAVVVFLYALTPSLRLERGRLRTSGYVRRHFSVLGALMLTILAWSYRLDAFALLSHGSGPDGIFASVDHQVNVQVNLLLALVTLAAAALVLWTGWTGQIRVAFVTVSSVIVLSLLLRQALPVVVQRMRAPGDPAAREFPYIATRAGYTRRAFGVERIRRAEDVAHPSLAEIARRGAVTTWDGATLARLASARLRARDQAGGAGRASAGWELGDDGIRAVIVMPNESGDGDPPGSPTPWLAMRVHAGLADERGGMVTRTDGLPDASADVAGIVLPPALVQDSAAGSAAIIVADTGGRFAGPPIAGWVDRLAHAWSQQNVRLLFADLPGPSPRVLRRRDVRERVRALAPFFVQGSSVVPLVAGRELYWTLDLYSASTAYPLSRRFLVVGEEWSYLQHAASAVLNAQSGRVWLVIDSASDPVSRSWRERFPGMFTPGAALPAAVARALPPAVDGALAQAGALARYGARGESPPLGQLPRSLGADSALATAMPPVIALAATQAGPASLAASIPVLDSTQHVLGVVLATGGTRRETLWYALPAPGPRWRRILDQLQRAPDSTVVAPADARLVRGAIRAVPVAGGLAFVQSTFSSATGRAAGPVLARVAILDGDSLYVGATLAGAAGLPDEPVADRSGPLAPQDFRARAAALYEAMRAAMARGDWQAFGQAYESLGQLLGRRRPPR